MEGLAAAIEPGSQMQYWPGVLLNRPNVNPIDWSSGNAAVSDVTFAVLGLIGLLEGEEGESIASPTYRDRLDYNLPQSQIDYLRKPKDGHDNPVVAIITGGSPMNLAEVHGIADAVLLVWYPGEEGGRRGRHHFWKIISKGRTYRYMEAEPLYPFGFGLSYTTFEYSDIKLSRESIKINL